MPVMYSDSGNQATTSTSNKTATSLQSIAGLRPEIYEFTIGAASAPNSTDCTINGTLQASTTAGTSTAFTPFALDPKYSAASAICGINFTVEPTYTAGSTYWVMGINQRATYRWVAAPGGNIAIVGTANNGVGMQVVSTNYSGQTDVQFFHME
jgi:hypothetical protein